MESHGCMDISAGKPCPVKLSADCLQDCLLGLEASKLASSWLHPRMKTCLCICQCSPFMIAAEGGSDGEECIDVTFPEGLWTHMSAWSQYKIAAFSSDLPIHMVHASPLNFCSFFSSASPGLLSDFLGPGYKVYFPIGCRELP